MPVSNASMASSARDVVVVDEPIRLGALELRWAAIIAGLVVALGAWVLLTVLGLALGLSSADPSDPAASLRSAGAITGIWSLVVPFVALLVGGVVAARTAGVVSRPTAAIHGLVLWGLTTIMTVVLLGYVVRGVVTTAAGLGSSAAGAVASRAPGAADLGESLGLRSGGDILAPVNKALRDAGRPTVTLEQLDAAVRDVLSGGARQGYVDHGLVVTSVARNTRLSPEDADAVAMTIERTVEQKRAEIGQDLQVGAAKAADATGKAMWWVFLGMILGLGSSVVGSALGVSRKQLIAEKAMVAPILTEEPAHSSA
jgi:hypothetical protein